MFGSSFLSSLPSSSSSREPSAAATPLPSSSSSFSLSSSGGLPFTGFASTVSTSTNKRSISGRTGGNSDASSPDSFAMPTTRAVALIASGGATSSSASSSSDGLCNSTVENSCISPDGRSFHSYLYDPSSSNGGCHAIVSDFAPFDNTASPVGSDGSTTSSLKITTVLPLALSDVITIDPVIGLICIDGTHVESSSSIRVNNRQRSGTLGNNGPTCSITKLPWMCLYTRKSAFVLSIGYNDDENKENYYGNDDSISRQQQQQRCIEGRILRIIEPYEKQLLLSHHGSTILRIRPASSSSSSNPVFHRRGSMAMLIKEDGGTNNYADDSSGYALVLYHGLPESIAGGDSNTATRGRDLDGGRSNPTNEGSVTCALRFSNEDLFRGISDTVDAENEAYNSSSLRQHDRTVSSLVKRVVDFCFANPSLSVSGNVGISATSIFLLCSDGSVYGASPIVFDGTILPRSVVITAIKQLDDEIEASTSFLQDASSSSPAPTAEHECVEARMRQCRAARRYLLDVFGIPDMALLHDTTMANQGSYYVSASVVNSLSYTPRGNGGYSSHSLAWQPRLQGPLILPADTSSIPPCVCIESFGGTAGAGIIDGIVVVRYTSSSSPIHVEFGIVPGEGAVLLPRFEFESDSDCQLIDELVRGTGMYVERVTIAQDEKGSGVDNESSRETPLSSRHLVFVRDFIGRCCSIVLDPLDDTILHVIHRGQIATITTNAIAVTAKCFASRMSDEVGESEGMSSIKTKAWSCLEVSPSGSAVVGARVCSDVHFGHVLFARLFDGSIEIVNVTAAHCLHETSELLEAKSVQTIAVHYDDKAMEALEIVQPLHEVLQPLVSKICDGLSKMGKIVGGATLPKDVGPENLAVLLDTQHSCEINVLIPMEEISKILGARRELLKEMHNHQAAELKRLSDMLVAFKQNYDANLERVVHLEANASILAKRSSAVLTATRELSPQITDAEAAYFKELQRYVTSCSKWQGTVEQIKKDASSSCDAMSAGSIENGEVQCLVNSDPQNIHVCQKLLRGEGQMLKSLEKKVNESSNEVEQLLESMGGARLQDDSHSKIPS